MLRTSEMKISPAMLLPVTLVTSSICNCCFKSERDNADTGVNPLPAVMWVSFFSYGRLMFN